jgi:hypothetical protein
MSHIMTITDGVPSFTCTAPADADCHKYPACECEHWGEGHEHPTVTNPQCWLALWYALGTGDTAEMYYSAERGDSGYEDMPANASGEIDIEFDECPLWSFVDLDAALTHEEEAAHTYPDCPKRPHAAIDCPAADMAEHDPIWSLNHEKEG